MRHLVILIVCALGLTGLGPTAGAHTYTYAGEPFGTADNGANTLPGSTAISVSFSTSLVLAPLSSYDLASGIFTSMTISDGLDTIAPGDGTFLPSSFIDTDLSGNITSWVIAERIGSSSPFVLGDQCCTIGDPPVLLTYCCNGPTDATIQTEGFFGIGPNTGYAYNNRTPGIWSLDGVAEPQLGPFTNSVPEPSAWWLMIVGFGVSGVVLRSRNRIHTDQTGARLLLAVRSFL
jgi:hypothetical protein